MTSFEEHELNKNMLSMFELDFEKQKKVDSPIYLLRRFVKRFEMSLG